MPFYNFNRVAVVEISRLPSRIDVHTVFRSLDEMAIRFDTNRSNHRFFTHLTKLFPISIIFTLLSTISSNLRNNTTIDNFVFYVVEAATTKFGSDLFDQVAIISSFLFFFFSVIVVFLYDWTILLFLSFLYAMSVSLKNVGTSLKPFGTRRNVHNESCWLCAETFYIRYK